MIRISHFSCNYFPAILQLVLFLLQTVVAASETEDQRVKALLIRLCPSVTVDASMVSTKLLNVDNCGGNWMDQLGIKN